jgi:hypothetical protein
VNCAFNPYRAAAKKFARASSKAIRPLTSPYSPGKAVIRPMKKAAFATSSRTVGPPGSARFSMRRCGRPSETP